MSPRYLLFLLYLCLPNCVLAEILEYEITGYVSSFFPVGTDLDSYFAFGDRVTGHFTLDTDAINIFASGVEADYVNSYTADIQFEGGVSITSMPGTSVHSSVHQKFIFPDSHHLHATVYSDLGEIDGGAGFNITPATDAYVEALAFVFFELAVPFEFQSLDLEPLPSLAELDAARVEIGFLQSDPIGGGNLSLFVTATIDSITVVGNALASCAGFQAPMTDHPVKVKRNRVFPLKMELYDGDGFELMGADLTTPPVVQVMFTAEGGGVPVDVTDDVLSPGQASEGNQFEYTDGGMWQFNLKSSNYTAAGQYLVSGVSGDETEYTIDPECITSFVIE